MEVTMVNGPLKSKINWFNILAVIGAILYLPELQEFGIEPKWIILAQGIVTVFLRTFANGKEVVNEKLDISAGTGVDGN